MYVSRLEGWWTFEVCHGKHVRQFHSENNVVVEEYVLGRWGKGSSDADGAIEGRGEAPSAPVDSDIVIGRAIDSAHPPPSPDPRLVFQDPSSAGSIHSGNLDSLPSYLPWRFVI